MTPPICSPRASSLCASSPRDGPPPDQRPRLLAPPQRRTSLFLATDQRRRTTAPPYQRRGRRRPRRPSPVAAAHAHPPRPAPRAAPSAAAATIIATVHSRSALFPIDRGWSRRPPHPPPTEPRSSIADAAVFLMLDWSCAAPRDKHEMFTTQERTLKCTIVELEQGINGHREGSLSVRMLIAGVADASTGLLHGNHTGGRVIRAGVRWQHLVLRGQSARERARGSQGSQFAAAAEGLPELESGSRREDRSTTVLAPWSGRTAALGESVTA
uniref:Uncharacterized protein n=1 Tax=Oryza nivara TaxID=4536 RepID=A0A0E0I8H3_ORYNI